jgi:hypothetical protein
MSVSQDINLASISQSVTSLSNDVIRLTMDDTLNDGDGSEFENRNVSKNHDVGSGEEGNNAGSGVEDGDGVNNEEDVNGINDEEVGDVASSEKDGDGRNGEEVDGKSGNNKHYEFVCEYNGDTANEDAEKALRDGKVFDQRWTRGNVWYGGSKIKYSCRNFPRCPKWLQKEISTGNNGKTIVCFYISDDRHEHENQQSKVKKTLHEDSKTYAEDLISKHNSKPSFIYHQLRKEGLPELTFQQINNRKSRMNSKKNNGKHFKIICKTILICKTALIKR